MYFTGNSVQPVPEPVGFYHSVYERGVRRDYGTPNGTLIFIYFKATIQMEVKKIFLLFTAVVCEKNHKIITLSNA